MSFGESVLLSLSLMAIVFLVLGALWLCIRLFSFAFGKLKK